MLSSGQLPRPSPNMGDGLPKFVPNGDDTFGATIPDFVSMPPGIGAPMDSPQEDLPDLLRDMRGEGPSRWGMDNPSFGEFEPTQCFPSATAAWGSAGFGGCGGGAAPAFGAGPSETFGAFNPQHQGQITDTAGTPFHPTTMPMVPMPYGQMHMVHPIHMHMMTPPHPGAAAAAAAATGYGFAPPPPPATFVNCTAFPPGMPMYMANMAMAMHMQGNPMPCPPFPPNATIPTTTTTAAVSAPPAVVPSASPPQSLTGAYNNNNGYMCNDGSSSGDEVVPAGPSCLLPRRKPGSITDDSAQHGLQVVPEPATNVQVAAAPAAVFPPGSNAVMLVPYNGGLMAVRRPAIATTAAAMAAAAAAASAAAAAMLNQGGNNHLSATSGSTAALPMLGVPVGSTRAASLERYRQKKASRSYSKHIRYHMRKVNADRRPRVKGRFIKASVVAEVAETMNNEMDAGDS